VAIITTAEFKTFRGISVSTYDTLIALLIGSAQAQAERYCDRAFDTGTYTEKHNGSRTNTLVLRNAPITSITSISLIDPDGNTTALDSSTYTVQLDSGVVKLAGSLYGWATLDDVDPSERRWGDLPAFPDGHQNLQVVYVGGYATAPNDLKMAMYMYVDALYARTYATGGEDSAYRSQTLGDWSYERASLVGINSVDVVFAKFQNLFNPFRRAV
jgi:uncharacterized phiE125 gp8 family phage protein